MMMINSFYFTYFTLLFTCLRHMTLFMFTSVPVVVQGSDEISGVVNNYCFKNMFVLFIHNSG